MGMDSNEGTERLAKETNNGMSVPAQPRKEERDNVLLKDANNDMHAMVKAKEKSAGSTPTMEDHHYYLRSQKSAMNDVQNKFNDIQIDERSRRRAKGALQ